jgi:hypothetical protein
MCAAVMLGCPYVCCELCVCSAPSHRLSGGGHSVAECALAEGKEGGGICAVLMLCLSLFAPPAASLQSTGPLPRVFQL